MNSIINVCGKHALFHTVKNAEFTGVYDKLVYDFANYIFQFDQGDISE
jgi:hypothetical protein